MRTHRGRLVVILVAAAVLLLVPIHGHEFVSGSPQILSNEETGIIILPEWVFADGKSVPEALWCGFLGWFAPATCLPEIRVTGLHLWFLRASGVEYHAIEPFPFQSAAYVFDGTLRWYRGRETWEWTGDHFRKLGQDDARLPFTDQRDIGDVIRAEGWTEHPVEGNLRTFSLGPYRVRYTRPDFDGGGPTEIVIEQGPVVGKLYSRVERWRFTGWVERLPELSVQEQQPDRPADSELPTAPPRQQLPSVEPPRS